MGMVPFSGDDGAADASIRQAAVDTAATGVQRASAAGLVAQPRVGLCDVLRGVFDLSSRSDDLRRLAAA
jgi:hypothetical protein